MRTSLFRSFTALALGVSALLLTRSARAEAPTAALAPPPAGHAAPGGVAPSHPAAVPRASHPAERKGWGMELAIGSRGSSHDAYTQTLETFGYERTTGLFDAQAQYSARLYKRIAPNVQLGISLGRLENESYRRHTDGASTYTMQWSTWNASALARAYKGYQGGRLQLFAEGTLGLTRSRSELFEEEQARRSIERHYGYEVSGSLGILLIAPQGFGLVAALQRGIAPTLTNELGEVHTDAATTLRFGLATIY